ncbi:hypothetical protein OAO16_02420 [Opitutales bacterium]|nr:hypothetical protein [Opitutales bacterium]
MNEIHFEYEGKAARLSLQMLKRERTKPLVRRLTPTGEVSSTRVLNGQSQTIDKSTLTADDLIAGDPELDLERGGRLPELELFTPAYLIPGEKAEIAHEFSEIEIVHTPEGDEKERRPRVLRSANLNDVHPIKFGKTFPIEKAFTSFVFRAVYQLVHDDGIGYEFLHGVAKRLHDKNEVALLGAGPKGNAPLILRDKGSPHRAFLYGELGKGGESDKYRLLLLLSNQELKLPVKPE